MTRGPALNAVARLTPTGARARRRRPTSAGTGRGAGALDGVPLAYKDMFHRAGELAEYGSTPLPRPPAMTTATVIARLDAAGAIDAAGSTWSSSRSASPATTPTPAIRATLGPSRITGGSTSGGATSVAARLVPATLGSDTGGSIRIPASLCGLVGIKPTYGRVSRYACMPLSFSLDHMGPLARHAEDCALVLHAIAGYDPNDPTTSRRPVEDYARRHRRAAWRACASPWLWATSAQRWMPTSCASPMRRWAYFRALAVTVGEVALPSFSPLNAARRALMLAEAAAIHHEPASPTGAPTTRRPPSRMLPGLGFRPPTTSRP